MPEPPDFEEIAVGIMTRMGLYDDGVTKLDIGAQLRQVWNARGAADREKVKAALVGEGCQPDGPYVTMLDSGLRRLDR